MAFGINPSFDWQSFGGNALQDLGYGLSTAPSFGSALGVATQRNVTLSPERAKASKEKDQLNQSVALLQSKFPDLADYAQSTGDYQTAFGEMFKRLSPDTALDQKYKQAQIDALGAKETVDPTKTYDGRVAIGQQQGLSGDALQTYALTGELPKADPNNLPTSYREFQLAQQDPEYGKTLASSSSKPPTDQDVRMQKLTEVVKPDIDLLSKPVGGGKTVYDSLGDLGNQAWNGVNVLGAKPLYGATSPEYQQAQSALSNIAQSYLYAISGQSAPQGEVDKIVASVTPQPFENQKSVDEKKRRLQTYVKAIELSKYDASGLLKGSSAGVAAPNLNDPLGIR